MFEQVPIPRLMWCRAKREFVYDGQTFRVNEVVFLPHDEARARFKAGDISVDTKEGGLPHVEYRNCPCLR